MTNSQLNVSLYYLSHSPFLPPLSPYSLSHLQPSLQPLVYQRQESSLLRGL